MVTKVRGGRYGERQSLDEYLSTDDDLPTHGVELPSTDKAPAFDILNDDPVPLGSELSDIQAADMVVQLRNLYERQCSLPQY